MNVKLSFTKTEPDPAHPARPILYFSGEIQTAVPSTMTGRVRMTVDNQIRWHFVSQSYFQPFFLKKKVLFRFIWQLSGSQGNFRFVSLSLILVKLIRGLTQVLIVSCFSYEGIQVGGVGSCYGILGSWTIISHDIDDPVGMDLWFFFCISLYF